MPVTGVAIAELSIGMLLLYSGYKGTTISGTVTGLFQGKIDSTDVEPIASGSSGSSTPAGLSDYPTSAAIEKLWTSNGGPADTASFASQVAMAESGGSATVTSSNPDGGTNVGIWQLDTNGVGSGHTVAELQNANLNAQITIAATNGGLDWTEWGDPVTDALPNHQYTPGG